MYRSFIAVTLLQSKLFISGPKLKLLQERIVELFYIVTAEK